MVCIAKFLPALSVPSVLGIMIVISPASATAQYAARPMAAGSGCLNCRVQQPQMVRTVPQRAVYPQATAYPQGAPYPQGAVRQQPIPQGAVRQQPIVHSQRPVIQQGAGCPQGGCAPSQGFQQSAPVRQYAPMQQYAPVQQHAPYRAMRPAMQSFGSGGMATNVLGMLNGQRARQRLGALSYDPQLQLVAERRAQQMAAMGYKGHPPGSFAPGTHEGVGWSSSFSPGAVSACYTSDPRMRCAGAAMAVGRDGCYFAVVYR